MICSSLFWSVHPKWMDPLLHNIHDEAVMWRLHHHPQSDWVRLLQNSMPEMCIPSILQTLTFQAYTGVPAAAMAAAA